MYWVKGQYRKCNKPHLSSFYFFYFLKQLNLAALFWNWKKKKHIEAKSCLFLCKCSLLQTFFSVLCWCVRLCECNIAKVDQLQRKLDVNSSVLSIALYYTCFATALSLIKLNLLPQNGPSLKCLDKSLDT